MLGWRLPFVPETLTKRSWPTNFTALFLDLADERLNTVPPHYPNPPRQPRLRWRPCTAANPRSGSSCIVHAKRPASLPKVLAGNRLSTALMAVKEEIPLRTSATKRTPSPALTLTNGSPPSSFTTPSFDASPWTYTELCPHLQDVDLVAGQQL